MRTWYTWPPCRDASSRKDGRDGASADDASSRKALSLWCVHWCRLSCCRARCRRCASPALWKFSCPLVSREPWAQHPLPSHARVRVSIQREREMVCTCLSPSLLARESGMQNLERTRLRYHVEWSEARAARLICVVGAACRMLGRRPGRSKSLLTACIERRE